MPPRRPSDGAAARRALVTWRRARAVRAPEPPRALGPPPDSAAATWTEHVARSRRGDDEQAFHGRILPRTPMTHQATLRNTGHQFQAQDGESVLQSALNAGLVLPYGCRDVACGSCNGKLI